MSIPASNFFEDETRLDAMAENARDATDFLKAHAHEGRLMILCYLAGGEKSVTELERLLSMRQPAVSQQLTRLRADRIITSRREAQTIYYSIREERSRQLMEFVYDMFCAPRDDS